MHPTRCYDNIFRKKVKRILCIDDDQDILESMDMILTNEGYEVETSDLPGNVFSLIHRYNPDLILLDIRMDSFNGLEICRAIKSYISTENLPIIIVSSDKTIETAKSEFAATDILIKPFSIDSLLGVVKKHLFPPGQDMQNTA